MFNSQKINTDPQPYFNASRGRFATRAECPNVIPTPRPEYDNNPNPVLLDYRTGRLAPDELEWMLGPEWENFWQEHVTPAHIDHARKVLERLAKLQKG